MLRSMIIGLAVAALLQVGVHEFPPMHGVTLAAPPIDWVKAQTDALAHLFCDGFTSLTH